MNVNDAFQSMSYGPAPENAQVALDWLKGHKNAFDLFINGRWTKAHASERINVLNPSTNEHLASVACSDEVDIKKAVSAALEAHSTWSDMPARERASMLYALARNIQKHAKLFAVLESLDNGKPIRESRDMDIPLAVRHFYHHAGWSLLKENEFRDYTSIGVIAQIIPWNFPLLMLAWKVAPALAMGNTVVLKPAEQTPLSALLFAEICTSVGLPKGVLNIITGDGDTGAGLIQHPDVKKIAFTGSSEVGKFIRKATAGSGKRLSLELGGKSPYLIFDDADLDSAVEGLVDAIWFNQGEVCCAGSKLLVQESIAVDIHSRLKERMMHLRVGHALDKGIDIGAIASKQQLDRIETLVNEGIRQGAVKWQPPCQLPPDGFYYKPTLLTQVAPVSTVAQEEIFGPVLVSMTFRSPDEAVALANNTRYGLAASVWTENTGLALDLASKIKAGTIWINGTNLFDAASGFGGYRESGFGREGGREGLYEYLILQDLPSRKVPQIKAQANRTGDSSLLDQTAKLYIGGKQQRPDGGYSMPVLSLSGNRIGDAGLGNRKDIRKAVEAAHKASKWTNLSGHQRAQILYFLAENMSARKEEFVYGVQQALSCEQTYASSMFEKSIERIMTYAGWADKFDGAIHSTLSRHMTLAINEAYGIMGIVCPENTPLLGLVSVLTSTLSMGNRVVLVPSNCGALIAADLYRVIEASDIPAGVVNIISGDREDLAKVLAAHDHVDAMWYFGTEEGSKEVESLSTGNLKYTWVNYGKELDWTFAALAQGKQLLQNCTQVKNIWIPYGV